MPVRHKGRAEIGVLSFMVGPHRASGERLFDSASSQNPTLLSPVKNQTNSLLHKLPSCKIGVKSLKEPIAATGADGCRTDEIRNICYLSFDAVGQYLLEGVVREKDAFKQHAVATMTGAERPTLAAAHDCVFIAAFSH
eukprot:4046621-Pleurochrysis_carterae.AAC.1